MHESESAFYYSTDWSPEDVYLSAAVNGDVIMLRRMLDQGMDVDTRDKEGVSAVLRAANAQKPQAVRFLLEAGASIDARDLSGRSLVHLAAAYPGTLGMLDEFLSRGLTVDDQFEGGVTPLMSALLRGHLEGAWALLERGADPCLRDAEGDTCVIHMLDGIYAFRSGEPNRESLDLLQELLRRGVDVHARGRYGRDAMSIAASRGLGPALAMLQRHGARVADHIGTDPTLLQQAWMGRHADEAKWLLEQGAVLDFHSAVALGRCQEVSAALEKDPALLHSSFKPLRTAPLGLALYQGQPDLVRLLLKNGADPNGPDPAGGALPNAVRHLADAAILELLIEHGAALDAADGDGNTALNYAARRDRLDLAELLLKAGADPNARTERGYTVIGFAHSDAMRTLLRRHGGVES